MSESDCIQIPAAFVERARRHVAATGQPLLEYAAPPYNRLVYACMWSPPEYELQDEPGPQEAPFTTWSEYAEYRGMEPSELLEEYGLEEEELDDELPDPFAMEGAPSSPGAGAYSMFEQLWTSGRDVVGAYECAETGELLGEVEAVDGPAPGNDYIGVSVDSPLMLSCLQFHLDRMRAGIRIEVGSTDG